MFIISISNITEGMFALKSIMKMTQILQSISAQLDKQDFGLLVNKMQVFALK